MNKTNIPWADVTWNPMHGCSPVGAGCKHCYARTMAETRLRGRAGYDQQDPFMVTLAPDKLNEPRLARKAKRIFVCSMGDLFHDDVPFNFVDDVFATMRAITKHTYMILTKRPARAEKYWRRKSSLPELSHVWLGVSVEDQATADERIPVMLSIPASVRFVSCEPLLGPVNLDDMNRGYLVNETIEDGKHRMGFWPSLDWVIAGPETGPRARRCEDEWIDDLHNQTHHAGVPFFDKRSDYLIREWPEGK